MLLHLWSDELYSFDGKEIYTVGRDIDKLLPDYLYHVVHEKQHKTLYVLNGPWSFTNTRIGCLAINTLCFLDSSIHIYHTNKVELYTRLYQDGLLPRYLFLYIGQRKKFWWYDLYEWSSVLCDIASGEDMLSFVNEQTVPDSEWMVDNLVWPMYASCSAVKEHIVSPSLLYTHRAYFSLTAWPLEPYYGVSLSFETPSAP